MLRCMSARIPLANPIRKLTPGCAEWPSGLSDLRDPPAQLYCAGAIPALPRAVAIVGTRYANDDGLRFARTLGRELAAAGVVVVSGGAAGIDTAAHLGALDAGGATVAVLATGLIDAYPKENAKLFAEIARGGALLCESEQRRSGASWLFLRRNRLIAALAQVAVVVQAPARSGALATARLAIELKRPVFAVPSAPWDPRGTGCLQLLRNGAEICASSVDILSLATPGLWDGPRAQRKPVKHTYDFKALGPAAQAVWQALRRGPCHPDGIATALDMTAAEVQEALLTLVIAGLCKQGADGNYVVSSS
jgi:DNA processing protein